MTVYFISGLGADERAFQRIKLRESVAIKHIKWIDPLKKESLQEYIKRLVEQIDTSEDFILVGLSFGGIIAIELAKILNPKKVILISSFTDRRQLPFLYRLIGNLRLNLLVPGKILKHPNFLVNRLFSVRKQKDKELLREILKDSSPRYLSWSIHQILNWKNSFLPADFYHIHGEKDKLLPCSRIKPNKIIEGAGHLMVYTHGGKVSDYINSVMTND